MDKFTLVAVAIICIAFIESVALFMGINGTILATTLATIAALVGGALGFTFGAAKKK